MPLSEHEQRVLDEIESGLYADDPKFASNVRRSSSQSGLGPNVWKFLLIGLVGLVVLVLGLAFGPKPGGFPILSLLGFLIMFGAGVAAMLRPGKRTDSNKGAGGAARKPGGQAGAGFGGGRSAKPKNTGGSFSDRMEERYRRRFEGGQ